MAFIDGAGPLEAGPLDRLKLSRESFKAPMSDQVDPTAAGLEEGKALLEVGRDGGPWEGFSREPPPIIGGCIMEACGGREVMDRPPRRSALEAAAPLLA